MKRIITILTLLTLCGCARAPEPKVVAEPAPHAAQVQPVPPQVNAPTQAPTDAQRIADTEQKRIEAAHQQQIQAQKQEQLQAQQAQSRSSQPVNGMKNYENYRDNVYETTFPGYKEQKAREAEDRIREAEWRAKGAEARKNRDDFNSGFDSQNPNPQRPSRLPVQPR